MSREEELIMAGAEITAPDCRECGDTFENCDCGHYSPKDRMDYLEDEGAI